MTLTIQDARLRACDLLRRSAIVVTDTEAATMEVADFGMGMLERTGLQLIVYVNTVRCCAKELVLFDGQTCPEHLHPPFDATPGKEETFRVRRGTVLLYVDGEPTTAPRSQPPYRSQYYTAWHELLLHEGDQYTVPPATRHWFQALGGPAIISEFSTHSRDDLDVFTDPMIIRVPRADSLRG